jgi:hypothetical protein
MQAEREPRRTRRKRDFPAVLAPNQSLAPAIDLGKVLSVVLATEECSADLRPDLTGRLDARLVHHVQRGLKVEEVLGLAPRDAQLCGPVDAVPNATDRVHAELRAFPERGFPVHLQRSGVTERPHKPPEEDSAGDRVRMGEVSLTQRHKVDLRLQSQS